MCIVSETRIEDPVFLIAPYDPIATLFSRFTLHISGNPVSSVGSQAGVGIILSMQVERLLLDRILVICRLCAFRLGGSILVDNSRL